MYSDSEIKVGASKVCTATCTHARTLIKIVYKYRK